MRGKDSDCFENSRRATDVQPIAPWAVVASLPFAPEIVLPTLDYFINDVELKTEDRCGFKATFNSTHPWRQNVPRRLI